MSTLVFFLIKLLETLLNSFVCNANNCFVTFLLISSVFSNPFRFSVDLILGNKKNSGGDKSGEYGEWFNFGIPSFS
jgi:hypothetical protein